jgi:hypothetical protein
MMFGPARRGPRTAGGPGSQVALRPGARRPWPSLAEPEPLSESAACHWHFAESPSAPRPAPSPPAPATRSPLQVEVIQFQPFQLEVTFPHVSPSHGPVTVTALIDSAAVPARAVRIRGSGSPSESNQFPSQAPSCATCRCRPRRT